jgi:sarcosine oxidase
MQQRSAIVLGLGAMGSSAAMHLASRWVRVIGLDRFDIPSTNGSSHGHSRMIRQCYYEHPDYVPLLRRAYALWRALERDCGRQFLRITGGLYMGRSEGPGAALVPGSLRSATTHALPHDVLTRAALAQRYPQFHLPDDYSALYEPEAGLLVPEAVIAAQAAMALRQGAELRAHEPAVAWSSDGEEVVVTTARARYRAQRLVICAGAWASQVMGDLGVRVRATRQVLGWVWPKRPEWFEPGRLPVWAIEPEQGGGAGEWYGFPLMPEAPGFKVALHAPGREVSPGDAGAGALAPEPGDEATFRPVLQRFIPDADGPLLALRRCMYEVSPDSHFIIDRHPSWPNVLIAAGFSGHGFKFASVVGEILADLATEGATPHPIAFLGLRRFAPGAGPGAPR